MSIISTCPSCSRLVAIPQGLDATALVRCPLCNAEYPLDKALELIPPELIPVEMPEATLSKPTAKPIKPPPAPEISGLASGLITEPFFTADAKPPGDVATPADAADETPGISAPPLVSSVILQYGTTLKTEQSTPPNFEVEETAQTTEIPLDDEVFSLIAQHKEQTKKESAAQGEPMSLGGRPQRKPKSVLRIFYETVLGGVVGITIAYIALAWIMGSRFYLPPPPKVLKPVLRFVLPDRIWVEKQPTQKNP